MEIQLLGPVRIQTAAGEEPLGGTKQRTILATLLLANGWAVSDRHISRMLWGSEPPATAAAQIYTYASRLRKQLGAQAPIVRLRSGYQLKVPGVRCDYHEFAQLTRRGMHALNTHQYEEAAAQLGAALALWRGEPLADVTDHLAEAERPQLQEDRLAALEGRIEADLILGRHRHIVSELTRLVAEHPLRERFRALLMTALYRSERQADAMQLYLRGRRLLADELGVDPGPLLTQTYQAILTGAQLVLPSGFQS
jgi:DNA-binding SARP family transcriptional activator